MTKERDWANVLADIVINDYIEHQTKSAEYRVESEIHGKGCCFLSCAHQAVNEVNSWIDWIADGDPRLEEYLGTIKYRLVFNKAGMYKIVQGDCNPEGYE